MEGSGNEGCTNYESCNIEGRNKYRIGTVSYTHLDVYKRQLLTSKMVSCHLIVYAVILSESSS